MSHITKIVATEIRRLSALEKMCEISSQLGLNWVLNKGKETYRSYQDGLQCNHELEVGANYSIGVIEKNGSGEVELMCDFFSLGGLTEKIGQDGALLNQLYSAAVTVEAAESNWESFSYCTDLQMADDGWLEHEVIV